MSRPRVSVLLPVRDEEPFLAECLESMSAQTLSDFELIAVDDGSTDATRAILEAHARADSRLRVLRQEPAGMVAAAERARGEARAPLLARMDADDVALPERLELQVAALEEEGLAAVGGRVEYFPEPTDGLRGYAGWLNSLVTVEAAMRDLWVECPLPGPGLTARVELLSYRDCGWPEDYDLVLRIWESGGTFRNVDALVHRWRDHPRRLTRTTPVYGLAAFRRCKVHFLRRTLLADGRAAVVWGAGPTGKAFARELLAAGTPLAAFVEVDSRKLGKRIHGAPVVPVERAGGFPGTLALGAVSGVVGRARLRELAAGLGLVEGQDFVAVA
ncbi:MAG TPA: glycosyltransferase family 2 protein [Gaiellaceae bacterium]|nr:glycosyltransferase family 2 protein [Gaiellaceae bacterium]